MRFLKLTLFFWLSFGKKKNHLSYEELIALPRSLSSWAWQPTKTQTFTSDLFNKKTSAVRIKASNPQPLDSSKISVLSFNKFPEIGQYEKPQELQESTPPGHLIFTLKVSSPFPPLGFSPEPKVRQFCSSGSSLVLRLNSVTKGVKGFPELAPWIQEAPRSVGKPKSV